MSQAPGEIKILAGIGTVCLQMSLLEYTIAGVIWALLDLDEETGAIVVGGLDILPRITMAINLAEHKKAPLPIRTGLREVRKSLQGGLLDRRNQAVHGAHILTGDMTTTKMHRLPHPKRIGTLTALDLYELSKAFLDLSQKTEGVWRDIGVWKFGPDHGDEDAPNNPANWLTRARLKLAKLLKPRV